VRNERHWKSVQESPLGLSRDVLLEQCSSDSTGLGSGSTNETAPAAQGQCVGFQTPAYQLGYGDDNLELHPSYVSNRQMATVDMVCQILAREMSE
jgi:hypothetical protein